MLNIELAEKLMHTPLAGITAVLLTVAFVGFAFVVIKEGKA